MLQKIMSALLAGVLLLAATGCSELLPKQQEETFYNGYLGLTANVPNGWYVAEKDDVNLTATKEESSDFSGLEKSSYGDGGYFLELLLLQNRSNSGNDNHAELHLYAEQYDSFPTLPDYVEACVKTFTGELEDGYEGTLVDQNEVTLNGMAYTVLKISVAHEDNNAPYIEEHYITKVGKLYFVAYINYWSDSDKSKEDALAVLNSFSLDPPKQEGDDAQTAPQTVYYNKYLGLTVIIPDNQYSVIVDDTNLTGKPDDTADLEMLEKQDYGDGGYYFDLLEIGTSVDTGNADHAELDLYCEGYPSFASIDEYVDSCLEYYTGPQDGGYEGTLISRDNAMLNGENYVKVVVNQKNASQNLSYMEEYYFLRIKDVYFVAYANYSENSEKSKKDAETLLNDIFYFGGEIPLPDESAAAI